MDFYDHHARAMLEIKYSPCLVDLLPLPCCSWAVCVWFRGDLRKQGKNRIGGVKPRGLPIEGSMSNGERGSVPSHWTGVNWAARLRVTTEVKVEGEEVELEPSLWRQGVYRGSPWTALQKLGNGAHGPLGLTPQLIEKPWRPGGWLLCSESSEGRRHRFLFSSSPHRHQARGAGKKEEVLESRVPYHQPRSTLGGLPSWGTRRTWSQMWEAHFH